MSPRRRIGFGLGPALAMIVAIAGCGSSATNRTPSLAGVPLIQGARVQAHTTRCDRGANAYCAVQLVATGSRYRSSTDMLNSERRHLKELGWGLVNADTGDESAAESPSHGLRLVFAAADLDLKDVDLGWIRRSRLIAHALSQTMFDRRSALSLMLEPGSS